jgi:hypothetical protein
MWIYGDMMVRTQLAGRLEHLDNICGVSSPERY